MTLTWRNIGGVQRAIAHIQGVGTLTSGMRYCRADLYVAQSHNGWHWRVTCILGPFTKYDQSGRCRFLSLAESEASAYLQSDLLERLTEYTLNTRMSYFPEPDPKPRIKSLDAQAILDADPVLGKIAVG